MRFDDQRQRMIEAQIMARGITDELVIKAFQRVKRECFVSEEWKNYAYKDHPMTIGHGQTISQPYIVALMMSLLKLTPDDKVLEIGTGSGYQTALLAEVVSEVYTIERIDTLMTQAKAVLKKNEYKNIYFKIGDGTLGWVNAIPQIDEFDKIIVSAGSPKAPENLIKQLKELGLMIIPQGDMQVQDLIIYEKKQGEVITRSEGRCVFVPLIGDGGWKE